MQQLTRDEIRGRVFAIENTLFTLAVTISIALTGRAIDVWGMSAALTTLAAAVGALLVALAWMWVVVNWQKWTTRT
jgi:hypothetical protein